MPFDLSQRTALVTGASRGLGLGAAKSLAQCGARVAINYCHNEAAANSALEELKKLGANAVLVQGDASSEQEAPRIVSEAAEALGPVDILVVNATPDQPERRIEDYSWQDCQAMLDFFIKSPFLLTKAVLPHMKQARHGRIINIGSEVVQRAVGSFSAYVSAKGGQAGFTRSMASELAPWGITVNLVAPGWIPTERHVNDPAEKKEGYRRLIPMQRWGTPADVGWAAAFFAADEASFITGQCLCVNGGMTPIA